MLGQPLLASKRRTKPWKRMTRFCSCPAARQTPIARGVVPTTLVLRAAGLEVNKRGPHCGSPATGSESVSFVAANHTSFHFIFIRTKRKSWWGKLLKGLEDWIHHLALCSVSPLSFPPPNFLFALCLSTQPLWLTHGPDLTTCTCLHACMLAQILPSSLWLFFFFKCVAQAGLELVILLPPALSTNPSDKHNRLALAF